MVIRQDEQDMHPVRLAAQAHIKLVGIHPFIDGNGRTSRLLMKLFLLKYGYPYAVIRSEADLRQRYYRGLDRAHMDGGAEEFEILVAERVLDMAKKYVGALVPGSSR
jgi:Fic family protein